jgi:hypothetical protein
LRDLRLEEARPARNQSDQIANCASMARFRIPEFTFVMTAGRRVVEGCQSWMLSKPSKFRSIFVGMQCCQDLGSTAGFKLSSAVRSILWPHFLLAVGVLAPHILCVSRRRACSTTYTPQSRLSTHPRQLYRIDIGSREVRTSSRWLRDCTGPGVV